MPAWKGNSNNPVPNTNQKSKTLSEKPVLENRSYQTRRDNDSRDVIKSNKSITLLDIDSVIDNKFKSLDLSVMDNGNLLKVPTMYASPEKWKSIRKDGYLRDYNGKIQLPVIVYSRTSSEKDTSMALFNRYLQYNTIKVYSQKNKYTKFSLLNPRNAPVNEIYQVTFPDHMIFTYNVIIWTEYIEQMNKLIEIINFESDEYWGTSNGYKFRTYLDSISHTTEVPSDEDRIVKSEFDLKVHGYLLPPKTTTIKDGSKTTTNKIFTPKKIIINPEIVATSYNLEQLDQNRKKWKNQNYPNLQSDYKIIPPPIKLGSLDTIRGFINNTYNISQNVYINIPIITDQAGSEDMIPRVTEDGIYLVLE